MTGNPNTASFGWTHPKVGKIWFLKENFSYTVGGGGETNVEAGYNIENMQVIKKGNNVELHGKFTVKGNNGKQSRFGAYIYNGDTYITGFAQNVDCAYDVTQWNDFYIYFTLDSIIEKLSIGTHDLTYILQIQTLDGKTALADQRVNKSFTVQGTAKIFFPKEEVRITTSEKDNSFIVDFAVPQIENGPYEENVIFKVTLFDNNGNQMLQNTKEFSPPFVNELHLFGPNAKKELRLFKYNEVFDRFGEGTHKVIAKVEVYTYYDKFITAIKGSAVIEFKEISNAGVPYNWDNGEIFISITSPIANTRSMKRGNGTIICKAGTGEYFRLTGGMEIDTKSDGTPIKIKNYGGGATFKMEWLSGEFGSFDIEYPDSTGMTIKTQNGLFDVGNGKAKLIDKGNFTIIPCMMTFTMESTKALTFQLSKFTFKINGAMLGNTPDLNNKLCFGVQTNAEPEMILIGIDNNGKWSVYTGEDREWLGKIYNAGFNGNLFDPYFKEE